MEFKKISEKIDELNGQYIRIWEDVCNLESPTADKKRVDAVGEYFLKMAKDRGWKIETEEYAQAGNAICITLNPDVDAAPVAISGHIDTVHPVGLFGTPAVRMDEEKIYGPGVTDCKGGVVAGFLAMDALYRCGFSDRPVKLIIQTDEETSSKQSQKKSIDFMCRMAKGAAAFLNAETNLDNKVVLARKGIARYRLVISGRSAHSSKCPEGANAIAEAAHKILELEKLKDIGNLTCNCGVIRGGTVGNTVPDHCEFIADIRFATQEDYTQVEQLVQKVADTVYIPGCSCRVEKVSFRPAMSLCDRNVKLLEDMNRIFTQVGLSKVEMKKETGGSDAAYTTIAGIPTVDSIGVLGGRTHSPEEFAYLKSLAEAAKRYAAVAMYV